jgi:hypothetical protein
MRIQRSSLSALYRLQGILFFSHKGNPIKYSDSVWYPHETSKANKNLSHRNILQSPRMQEFV